MKKYLLPSIILIIHGGLIEILGCLFLIPILLTGTDNTQSEKYISFIIPYFQENLYLMMGVGFIYGVVRIIGAVGLLKNRMWGLALSVIVSIVTLVLMTFMLPAGLLDGILASVVLIMILIKFFGVRKAY